MAHSVIHGSKAQYAKYGICYTMVCAHMYLIHITCFLNVSIYFCLILEISFQIDGQTHCQVIIWGYGGEGGGPHGRKGEDGGGREEQDWIEMRLEDH